MQLIEVQLKARWVLLCGTGIGGNRLYCDFPPVWSSLTHGPSESMCSQSELCQSMFVSVDWSASGGGSGQGCGIWGWEDDSTWGRDSRLRVSRIHSARSSLRDRKKDRHIQSTCCHVTSRLHIRFHNAKRNRAQSPAMYCTKHRAWPPLLSLSNSIVFGVNGSLTKAFGGVAWYFRTNFGGRSRHGAANPLNIIASCKASVAAAHTVVSLVNGTGKGTRPTTSSPSVSWPAHGTSTSVHPPCRKSALAIVKGK